MLAAGRTSVADFDQIVALHRAFQQHGELVATEPRHQVAGAHAGRDARRCHLQQLVAGRVAEGVVDDLETIEVEVHHREAGAGIETVRLDGDIQALQETISVRQVGQAVVVRDVVKIAFGLAP